MSYSLNNFYFSSNINPTSTNGTCSVSDKSIKCTLCNEKCQLSFKNAIFSASCSTILSGLQFSNIVTDTLNPSPIKFNENDYSISEMFLNVYSWGLYSVSPCCEIVMVCVSSNGVLIICIPVYISATSQSIAIPSTIPNEEIISSSVSGVSLSNYFPSSPFIYYQAPYSTETTYADYIVFPESTLTIAMISVYLITSSTGNHLLQYQSNSPGKTPNYISGNIYYNANGIGSINPSSDEIYIECNPTDYSETNVIIETPNSPSIKDATSQASIVWFIICGAIVFALILFFISYLYRKYSANSKE